MATTLYLINVKGKKKQNQLVTRILCAKKNMKKIFAYDRAHLTKFTVEVYAPKVKSIIPCYIIEILES